MTAVNRVISMAAEQPSAPSKGAGEPAVRATQVRTHETPESFFFHEQTRGNLREAV